jgi:hypothetical protein
MTDSIRFRHSAFVALVCASLTAGAVSADAGVTATATATIGGRQYASKGPAECTHTAHGSIYDVPATIWHASLSSPAGGLSHVSATIFQTTTGAQVTLSVEAASREYAISTVTGGRVSGAATSTAQRSGSGGGTLSIDGRTAAGDSISLTISCSGFVAPEDNG